MEAKDLKKIADENKVEYPSNANKKKMLELLDAFGVEVSDSDKPTEYIKPIEEPAIQQGITTNFDHELKKMAAGYKLAETPYDIRKADQERALLRNSIKDSNNSASLLRLLKWERKHGYIAEGDKYFLNAHEAVNAKGSCENKSKLPSPAYYTKVGNSYPYNTYFDEARESEMFVFYVDREVSPEEQISKELQWKMDNGYKPEKEEWEKPKTLWLRFTLRESEFKKFFRIEDALQIEI